MTLPSATRVAPGVSAWAGVAVLGVLAAMAWWQLHPSRPGLLLAPMMNVSACLLEAGNTETLDPSDWRQSCRAPQGSAAKLVESTLSGLGPATPGASGMELGYTLQVPLLSLLQQVGGEWQVDRAAVDAVARTVRDNPRSLVLYLFGTHFSTGAPIEPVLAAQPENLAQTPQGPLPPDTYYGHPVYPWSVARTDNRVTQYRTKVIDALTQALCTLPGDARDRIKGITLLGEVHQFFPNFESGMGFGDPYLVSDYSPASAVQFRQYLQGRFADIAALNRQMGSDYSSFSDIDPPAKNIRHDRLRRYQDHIDSFAAGQLPISGWVHAPDTPRTSQRVQIYLDGKRVADAPVKYSRQDVRAAHPEFGTADVGWRHDLDLGALPAGVHRVDMALSQVGRPLLNLGSRRISVMDRSQKPPAAVPSVPLPAMAPLPPAVAAYTDQPRDQSDYYYNALAREWQAFRETQVQGYLDYFDRVVASSCLEQTPRYTHQILPQFNPSWDSAKYAVKLSLQPSVTLRTGISLYGEASYGGSFPEWLGQTGHRTYGVTEFHPLQAMTPAELERVLVRHGGQGARFVSFFLETRWQGQRVRAEINPFAFDPDNHLHGSQLLYTSMQGILAR